jgi:DNA-binding response OmpR family regulator
MTRILFIDDDVLTLELMGRVADLLGHQALLCSTASQAFEIVSREQPGLILVDYHLTDSDGLEFIQNLRCKINAAETPVYILSAGVSAKMKEDARLAGATGILEKPLSLDILSQVIKKNEPI